MGKLTMEVCVERIKDAEKRAAAGVYDIGLNLYTLYTENLYDKKYKSWNRFLKEELGFTSSYGFILMDCARSFSRQDVEKVGITKLNLVLRVPEQHRVEAIFQATRLSRVELATYIREQQWFVARNTGREDRFDGTPAQALGIKRGSKKPKLEVSDVEELKQENARLKSEVERLRARCKSLEKTIAPTLKELSLALAS